MIQHLYAVGTHIVGDLRGGNSVAIRQLAVQGDAVAGLREVLAYDGESGEFVELRPDGLRVLDAMREAGSLGTLLDTIDPALPGAERSRKNLERFAADLHRLGVLAPGRVAPRK